MLQSRACVHCTQHAHTQTTAHTHIECENSVLYKRQAKKRQQKECEGKARGREQNIHSSPCEITAEKYYLPENNDNILNAPIAGVCALYSARTHANNNTHTHRM